MSKPTSGRLLYFFVAVGAIVPAVLAVCGWSFLRTEKGERLWSTMALSIRESFHPAAADLQRIGCEQAVVTTVGAINDAQASRFSAEDRARLARSETREMPWVTCVSFYGDAPTCEEVAATHGPFASGQPAVVTVMSGTDRVCTGVHATDGERLGELTRETLFGERDPAEASP